MNISSIRPLVWVVAAVAVTATATALITASLLADNSVRSPAEVADALAAARATPPDTPTATGTPTVTSTGSATPTTTVVGATGDLTSTLTPGIVTVHCEGSLATLVSWSPNPGWRADDPVRGPAAEVSVRFESDIAADYKVTAICAEGVPVVTLGPDDHHGGGRGRGGDDDRHGDDDD